MINEAVINEIYKKFNKPHKNAADLKLDYYIPILSAHHSIENNGFEITLRDVDEYSPFRQFLVRSLNAVLEFDKLIAFVFRNHILFLCFVFYSITPYFLNTFSIFSRANSTWSLV